MSHVLILGAKSDIGMAIARTYADNGYALYLAARNTQLLDVFKKDITIRSESDVSLLEFDVTDMESHNDFFQRLEPKPEIVICVIGYLGDQQVAQNDLDEFQHITSVNYTGCASILSVIANFFESQESGSLIAVSSVAGERGRKSNYIYGSAKAALTSFMSGLRNRLHGSGVHVLTVKPGFVDTKMTRDIDLPEKLTAQPEEVAKAVFRAQQKRIDVVYVKSLWRWIMLIIRSLPEFLFKKTSF